MALGYRLGFDPRPHARGDSIVFPERAIRLIVSIHAPTRGATPSPIDGRTGFASTWFRSTPPREGRRGATRKQKLIQSFDPRPHARGDRGSRLQSKCISIVSIHAPTRGATSYPITLTRAMVTVSIHAPTRGATWCRASAPPPPAERVSIHAPTRGATWRLRVRHGRPSALDSFDPRPHARGDARDGRIHRHFEHVSIHAPTRGATLIHAIRARLLQWFRSTPPREGRRGHLFRSTPPREGRGIAVSIHAPTRGATMFCAEVGPATRFDPRPHARGDS